MWQSNSCYLKMQFQFIFTKIKIEKKKFYFFDFEYKFPDNMMGYYIKKKKKQKVERI